MWLTCCALHNLLLNVDRLHTNWNERTKSDSEQLGMLCGNTNQPFAISRLNRPFSTFNNSITNDISAECDKYSMDGKRIVYKMPLSLFK